MGALLCLALEAVVAGVVLLERVLQTIKAVMAAMERLLLFLAVPYSMPVVEVERIKMQALKQ